MLSTFRALKPSESDSKAQFLKCLSHLRKVLASCDHDCYVIRNERLHASACPPLVTANCDLLVADLIYNLCTQERIILAQFCQMHVHLKDVSWFCFVTRHRKQKSVSSCILFLFCLSTNASCK